MSNKDLRVFLRHIIECVDKVEMYLKGMTLKDFKNDELKFDAVIRNIEIIGEAANNLTRDFRSKNEQIDWRQIIDTRNRIIHGYATVDLEIIWNITQDDLPKLKREILKIIEERD